MSFDPYEPAAAPRPNAPPPLFGMLAGALRNNAQGTVTFPLAGGNPGSLSVLAGRVVQVTHPATASTAVLDMLQRAGLVQPADLAKVERAARRANLPLEEGAVAAGLVSQGTLAAVRESLCREAVLSLLLDRSLQPSGDWNPPRGIRESCALPLPFLLREAQKRHAEAPSIRRVVGSADDVFARSAALNPGSEAPRWEDLKLAAGERQVFFFVDGHRTVRDLTLATCQGEYEVSRALASLHEAGLVRSLGDLDARRISPPARKADRSALLRLATLLLAVATLVGGIAWGAWSGRLTPPVADLAGDPYRALVREAPRMRLEGALRLYRLQENRPPESFQDLLDRRLVLSRDARAAAALGLERLSPSRAGAP